MHPSHPPKVGKLEHLVHDPHDVLTKLGSSGKQRHAEGYIRRRLVIGHEHESPIT